MPTRRSAALMPAVRALLAGALVLSASGCATRAWFKDAGARPTRISNPREPNMRVELARGSGYYLAQERRLPDHAFGSERQYLLVDIGYLNPVVALSNRTLEPDPEQPYSAQSPDWVTSPVTTSTSFGGALRDASSGGQTQDSRRDRQQTLQLSVPVAFNLYWDPFTENEPILNTDYSFGIDLGYRVALVNSQELRFGVNVGHISTHLGDEYVIAARAASRPEAPFDRVNVSYWPVRGSFTWRVFGRQLPADLDEHSSSTAISVTGITPPSTTTTARGAASTGRSEQPSSVSGDVRYFIQIGGDLEYSCLPSFKCDDKGYYQVYPGEANPARVPLIKNALEGSFSAELRWYTAAYGSKTSTEGTTGRPGSLNAGVTVAERRVFPYGNVNPPRYGTALNVVVGYALPISAFMNVRYVQPYARYYRGPNPYGQFRNQRDTYFAGLGVTLTP